MYPKADRAISRIPHSSVSVAARSTETYKRAGWIALAFLACVLWSAHTVWAAVTISYFSAQGGEGQVKLIWTTASELKNRGFNVERSIDQQTWQHLGNNPSVLSQSPCIKNVVGASYQFIDTGLESGRNYFYRLQMVGQPCGDPNTYYEQIISAMTTGPTPTATATVPGIATSPATRPTFTATPTAFATPLPTFVPSVTPTTIASATASPNRTPQSSTSLPTPLPTKLARASIPSTQVPDNQNIVAPPLPTNATSSLMSVGSTDVAEPAPALPVETSGINNREIIFTGALGLAGLFGIGALVCAAIAIFLFVRPNVR